MKNILNSFFTIGLVLFILVAIVNCFEIYNQTIIDFELYGNAASDMFENRIEKIYIISFFVVVSGLLIAQLRQNRKN